MFIISLLLIFTGCDKKADSSIDNPVSPDTAPELAKFGSSDQYEHGSFGNFTRSVFTLNNSSSGNEVLMYSSSGDGTLTYVGSFPTGGNGSGSGLGSQGALRVDGHFVFAVNAGSDEISVLKSDDSGLSLVDKKPSGGTAPISLTVHGNLLYVLNSGGEGNITGFRIKRDGTISQIDGSSKPLSGSATAPAQIEFNPSGRILVVTEKATNIIDTYVVGLLGRAHGPSTTTSSGDTPYGFVFDNRGRIIVSDAYGGNSLAGAMSSYNVESNGVRLITGPVYDSQTAPCWVAITNNSRFAYTTNTGTSNISGYFIDHRGRISLFDDGGNTASTGAGSKPIDMAVSGNSQYLYALSAGTNTISVFRIDNGHGGLTPIETISGLPAGAGGLAAN